MTTATVGTLLDMLPERYPYRDDGCEVSPSCLRCPLPQCKYDDPGWLKRHRRNERDQEVVSALRERGFSVPEVAQHFAMSQRTVFRIVKRAGAAAGS